MLRQHAATTRNLTLALLCQFTAQNVSDVNTSIFRSLLLLGALLCRLYCAVMIEVYVLIYLSSDKCYTYIMCRVVLCLNVFLQACGVLKMDVLTSETC